MADDTHTEKPTGKRRSKAREQGQIARSRDVTQVAVLAVSVVMLGRWGGHMITLLRSEMSSTLLHAGDAPLVTPGAGDIGVLVTRVGGLMAVAVAPIALAAMVASITSSVAQSGLAVSAKPLALNFGKLNPLTGMKRFASLGGFDVLKMGVLVLSLGVMTYWATLDVVHGVPQLSRAGTASVMRFGWEAIDQLMRRSLLVLGTVAVVDYVMQRHRLTKSLMMTKQEVKDEARESEGNPETKARVRKIQHQMHRKRMLSNAKKATVVVTNPTHFAVALEYDRATMVAPRVVAKGQDLLAQRIKEVAREAGVPIIEQVALARALYKSAEVGETIPGELFEAVAEVLAYLIRLKQLVL